LLASAAHAGSIIDPVSASTNMGTVSPTAIDNVLNQSGLTPGYTSGVTDLNTYLNTNPLHDGLVLNGYPPVATDDNVWRSAQGVTTGNFDFDLGGSMSIDAYLFWGLGTLAGGRLIPTNIAGFTLLAADNPSFTNATTIGSFTTDPSGDGDQASVRVQVFAFSNVVTASYVRMEITSNDGDGETAFGQAAFDGVPAVPSPVPLPAAVWSGMTLLVGLGLAGKFRKNRQLQG
jgi:hypothetical protein